VPFEVKPAYSVLFEDVNGDAVRGEAIPVHRATATNPVGLFLRTKEFRFDLSPGPKRKPVAMGPDVRGSLMAELDRDTFVLFEPRFGEVQLVRGATTRTLMGINQVPDVNYASLTLARRPGAGDDVLGVAVVQSGTGAILLGDIDLARGTIGPLRVAGNALQLDIGAACVRGSRDHRLVMNEHTVVRFEPPEDGREGQLGSSLISVGSGRACLEASEMHLANESTLVVRYSGTGSGGHPALVHGRGKSVPATCTYE